MAEDVADTELFHITRLLPYNFHPPISVGDTIEAGSKQNPFFRFYEETLTFPITHPTGQTEHRPAISFLNSVRNGELNCPTLPSIAITAVIHYRNLARELILEQVRLKAAPGAPSRTTCLWLTSNHAEAIQWLDRLGRENVRVLRVRATGNIHLADAGLMLHESEPVASTYVNAGRYWAGEMSPSPQPEVLFSGKAMVVDEVA